MNCFRIRFCVFISVGLFVLGLVVVFSAFSSLLLFGCQYQCNLERLVPEMTYYVWEWDVTLHTHSSSCTLAAKNYKTQNVTAKCCEEHKIKTV